MGMWCMLASPLLMSADLRSIKREFKDILLNKNLIKLNQVELLPVSSSNYLSYTGQVGTSGQKNLQRNIYWRVQQTSVRPVGGRGLPQQEDGWGSQGCLQVVCPRTEGQGWLQSHRHLLRQIHRILQTWGYIQSWCQPYRDPSRQVQPIKMIIQCSEQTVNSQ